jgi:molybdopterin synthase sulfur carrier subunit
VRVAARTGSLMHVRVRFFASLRERLGRSDLLCELPGGTTVADLWQSLCTKYDGLTVMSASVSFAVNQAYVASDHRLSDGDEVACIPPVSGG